MWLPIIRQHSALSASMNRSFSGGAPMLTRMWVDKRPPIGRMMTPFRRNAPPPLRTDLMTELSRRDVLVRTSQLMIEGG
jgi:hypothetical protein